MRPSCGGCMFLQAVRENGEGECYRYPPSVVVLVRQIKDVERAQMAAQQAPTRVRPTMLPGEFCGEFRPRPAMGGVRPVLVAN